MIKPNFMEKLFDGIEVEWKPLGEVVNTITAPAKVKKESYRDNGRIPIIDQGIDFIAGYTDEDINPVHADEYVVFGDHSEHIKYVDFAFIQGADGLKILKSKFANTKYIYYALINFYQRELNYKRHWSSAKETLIPIPCPDNPEKSLEIQAEIVRILDTFTEHTAELTAELIARKKQYNYYEYELLKFQEKIQFKKIGDCCNIEKGKTPIQKAVKGKYPLVATTEERQSSSEYQFDCAAVCVPLISSRGHGVASISRIYFQEGKFALGNILCAITPNDDRELSAKFLRYYLFAKKDVLLVPLMRGGANVSLTIDSLKKVKIPIPPIEEQTRIVSILDKFDILTNSISEGLPREIELRQKQYEYYRNVLLSFPKEEEE